MMKDRYIIVWDLDQLGPADVPYRHAFELKDTTPSCSPLRRLPERLNEIVKKEIVMMLIGKGIKPANSTWGFAVVIFRKKDGSPRFCVEYRTLNKRMKADKYPTPNVEEILDKMARLTVFSKLDRFMRYWQVRLADHVQEQTTFRCKYRSFQFEVMPFGLMNAPALFQRMASSLFKHMSFVKVYIDDIVIGSKYIAEHIGHLLYVCHKFHESGLNVKLSKC